MDVQTSVMRVGDEQEVDEEEVLVIVMAPEIPQSGGAQVLLDQRVHVRSTTRDCGGVPRML